jgi:hypothetical protein
MKKQITAMALALLILAMTACSGAPAAPTATPPASAPTESAPPESAPTEAPEPTPTAPPTPTESPAPQAPGIVSGDVIQLGTVSFQSFWGNDFSQDVEWTVLDVSGGKALVVSRDIVELRPYNEPAPDITWAVSDVRKWLNSDFFEGLTADTRERIALTELVNDGNPEYDVDGGEDTEDKIFLLSYDEVSRYMADSAAMKSQTIVDTAILDAVSEEIGRDQGYVQELEADYGSWYWWTRTPGSDASRAATYEILGNGYLSAHGAAMSYTYYGVRPAFWLDVAGL